MDLKRLHEAVVQKIDARNSSFWAARNAGAIDGPGLGLMERQRLKLWMNNAFDAPGARGRVTLRRVAIVGAGAIGGCLGHAAGAPPATARSARWRAAHTLAALRRHGWRLHSGDTTLTGAGGTRSPTTPRRWACRTW